jgi:toxin-antitoxin system PIN domain toxin
MAALLDVNVLVALAWPNHVHHVSAIEWFLQNRGSGWATSPLTQSGFVRVSSNRHVIPEAQTPASAITLLRQLTQVEGHTFWQDDIELCTSKHIATERIVGYRQVTDAHLVALAIARHGRLATFDRGIRDVIPAGVSPDQVLVFLN